MKYKNVFIDKTFKDTLSLLYKARVYAQSRFQASQPNRSPLTLLQINSEMMRVTSRLTQVMAWVLAQKAFLRGELTFKEASAAECGFFNDKTCLASLTAPHTNILPPTLQALLEESQRLYIRVSHLAHLRDKAR